MSRRTPPGAFVPPPPTPALSSFSMPSLETVVLGGPVPGTLCWREQKQDSGMSAGSELLFCRFP